MALQGCIGDKDYRAAFSIARFKLFESGLDGDEIATELDRLWKIKHGHRLTSKTPKPRIRHVQLPSDQKWCNGCEKPKLRTEFQVDRSRKDGLHNRCRVCCAGYFKETQSRRCNKCGMSCVGTTCARCCRLAIILREADVIGSIIPQILLAWRDQNLSIEAHKVYKRARDLADQGRRILRH